MWTSIPIPPGAQASLALAASLVAVATPVPVATPVAARVVEIGAGGQAGAAGGTSQLPPWSDAPVLLTADKAIDLFVAPDEGHVAYSLTRSDPTGFGCLGRAGVGDLRVLVTDPAPATSLIDSLAGFTESHFTDDSQWLAFTEYTATSNPCAAFVGLRYSPAAGGTSNYLFSGAYYYEDIAVAGKTVAWRSYGSASNDPGTRGAHQIGGGSASFGPTGTYLALDPTGSSVSYDAGGEIRVATPGGTTKFVLNDGSLGLGAGYAWSADGTLLAYGYKMSTTTPTATLTLRNADGSNLRTIATDCRCQGVAFSPDSARLAYDIGEADGSTSFVVQPVSGGAAVKLTGIQSPPGTSGYQTAAFSADGRWLDVVNPGNFAVYTAPLSPPGPFVLLSSPTAQKTSSFISTPGHDHLAFIEVSASGASGAVVATPSGQRNVPIASGVTGIWYEQTGASPSLAVSAAAATALPTTITLFPTDGTGSGKVLPAPSTAYTPPAFWVGPVFVYPTNVRAMTGGDTGYFVDLIAVSDDAAQVGVLDRDTIGPPKTGPADPTRLFYARDPASGGGIYMFEPPGTTRGTGGTGGGSGTGGAGGSGGSGAGTGGGSGGAGGGAGGTGNAGGSPSTGSTCHGGAPATGGSAGAAICSNGVTLTPGRYTTQNGTNSSLAIGDLNHDGMQDLVITGLSPGTIKVLLGASFGGFTNGPSYYTQPSATSVGLGKLRPNGYVDVVVTAQAGAVQLGMGAGDGSFFLPAATYTTGAGAQQVVMGDFDADGDLDFAVACATDAKVILYINDGNGNESFNLHYPYAAEPGTASAAAGDLNCDGMLDLVASSPTANDVSVFTNDGTGKLQSRVVYPAGTGAHAVAVGDLNRDGAPDIAVANTTAGNVGVYLNRGDGTFGAAATFPAGTSPVALALADLNRDGSLDVVVGSSNGGGISVLLGHGDGTLAAPSNTAATYNLAFLAAGDLNGDGRPDLASANADSTVTVWTTSCTP